MEKLKNTRILGSIGLVGCFLGTILPYITVSIFGYSRSISLWGYWEGKVIMVLIIGNLLFIFRDFIKKYVPQMYNSAIGRKIETANSKLVIIPTILIAAFAIYMILRLDLGSSEYLHYGIGFWVLWIGIIALFGHSFIYKGTVLDNENFSQNQAQQNINNVQPQQPVYNQPQQNNYQQPVQQQPMNSEVQNVKYCTKCGNKVDQNATTCFMCGNNF